MKGKGGNAGNGAIPIEKKYLKSQDTRNATASSNPFVVISPSNDQNSLVLKEGELDQSEVHKEDSDVNLGSQE